jgi:hypothetical protein
MSFLFLQDDEVLSPGDVETAANCQKKYVHRYTKAADNKAEVGASIEDDLQAASLLQRQTQEPQQQQLWRNSSHVNMYWSPSATHGISCAVATIQGLQTDTAAVPFSHQDGEDRHA